MEEKKLTDEEWFKEYTKNAHSLEEAYSEQLGWGGTTDENVEREIEFDRRLVAYVHRLQDENEELKSPKFASWKIKFFNLKEEFDKELEEHKEFTKNAKAEIERLTLELKNLDWYKMWHNKFKKKIDDLTLELETYRPTKLSGNGQCKCSKCGVVSWTDWFSRYKGQTLCDKCLKEIISTEEKQAVKDTAKEIYDLMTGEFEDFIPTDIAKEIVERYGVEVK